VGLICLLIAIGLMYVPKVIRINAIGKTKWRKFPLSPYVRTGLAI
jgi:hypothetical protein